MDTDDTLRLESFLPYRLSVLSNRVSSTIAALYAHRFNLTIPEWRVIAVLGRFPGLSAAELVQRTEMDKVAISRAVSKLLKTGRIRRQVFSDDRRRSRLELSKSGQKVYQQIVPLARSYEEGLLSALNERQRDTLDSLLDALLARSLEMKEIEPQ
jgi:DNA-binding MarR family transcriptional regulator